MRLILNRITLTKYSTEGELYVEGDSDKLCVTLELPVRDGLPGSAIPPGAYPVTLGPSPKFLSSIDPWVKTYADRIPHINEIPGRSNILIHWGNDPKDTEGCILVGTGKGTDYITGSRLAFAALWQRLVAATEPITITVNGGISNHDQVQQAVAE